MTAPSTDAELAVEQKHVTTLYAKLDAERDDTAARLAAALRDTGGTPQQRTERDVSTTMYRERLTQLDGVEAGLCFGRIDGAEDGTLYIGRIGLFDDEADYEPLLIDWRAPAARPFYLATAASPQGVRRRRHLRLRLRKVVDFDDEVLDIDADDAGSDLGLAGEAALLAALNRQRDDAMRDIVSTIQAEQDEIIRSGLPGVLVVQGGPGTGKTAVALHRAAYLLYEHREILANRGVLVVGPNETFLRYIGQVLPSLGESGVLLATIGELFPGVRVRATESAAGAEVKGRPEMVDVLTAAVADSQRVPDAPLDIEIDGEVLRLEPEVCAAARLRARDTEAPHNVGRRVFVDSVLDSLAARTADRIAGDVLDDVPEVAYVEGEDPDAGVLGEQDVTDIKAELARDPQMRRVLDELWPELTPQRLLSALLTDPERLDSAARGLLSGEDKQAVLRKRALAWTSSDMPLLDELADLLGADDEESSARREREERERRAYAEGVLDILDQDEEIADEERLRVADVLDAELLAERERAREQLSVAERAAADRSWAFGHVIVDEAQELTAMDWRMIMRRCPSRSMTVVGDIAQTSAVGGASSWSRMLRPHVADRWRLAELTVNYRTPAEIMTVAARTLAELDPALRPPRSVRQTGVEPWQAEVPAGRLTGQVAELAARELAEAGQGTVAVLAPKQLVGDLREAADLDRLSVLTVDRAKGLEFDGVIVVAPEEIAAASARGLSDLYVALTRATQRLGIVRVADA